MSRIFPATWRRNTIPLTDGTLVDKGGYADTDQVDPLALGAYRTLVVRRSPSQSRPPSAYRLIRAGDYYEAWQRDPDVTTLPARLPLGDAVNPYGVPKCADVRALARQGDLIAAAGEPPLTIEPGRVSVPSSGDYDVWLGGSIRPAASWMKVTVSVVSSTSGFST